MSIEPRQRSHLHGHIQQRLYYKNDTVPANTIISMIHHDRLDAVHLHTSRPVIAPGRSSIGPAATRRKRRSPKSLGTAGDRCGLRTWASPSSSTVGASAAWHRMGCRLRIFLRRHHRAFRLGSDATAPGDRIRRARPLQTTDLARPLRWPARRTVQRRLRSPILNGREVSFRS